MGRNYVPIVIAYITLVITKTLNRKTRYFHFLWRKLRLFDYPAPLVMNSRMIAIKRRWKIFTVRRENQNKIVSTKIKLDLSQITLISSPSSYPPCMDFVTKRTDKTLSKIYIAWLPSYAAVEIPEETSARANIHVLFIPHYNEKM